MKKPETDPTYMAPWDDSPIDDPWVLKEIVTFDSNIMAMEAGKRLAIEYCIDKEHPLQVGDVVAVNTYHHEGEEMKVTNRGMMFTRKPGGIIKGYYFWAIGVVLSSKVKSTGEWRGNQVLYLHEKADLDMIAEDDDGK